jgi:hypothetical protein
MPRLFLITRDDVAVGTQWADGSIDALIQHMERCHGGQPGVLLATELVPYGEVMVMR